MKFMILMIPGVYQDGKDPGPDFAPDPKDIEQMTRFNEDMGKSLKITDLNGLQPQSTGARVTFDTGKAVVTDGPFIESKEVLGGYWLVEADSKQQVVEWMQKCPAREDDVIEIRQVFEFEDGENA